MIEYLWITGSFSRQAQRLTMAWCKSSQTDRVSWARWCGPGRERQNRFDGGGNVVQRRGLRSDVERGEHLLRERQGDDNFWGA